MSTRYRSPCLCYYSYSKLLSKPVPGLSGSTRMQFKLCLHSVSAVQGAVQAVFTLRVWCSGRRSNGVHTLYRWFRKQFKRCSHSVSAVQDAVQAVFTLSVAGPKRNSRVVHTLACRGRNSLNFHMVSIRHWRLIWTVSFWPVNQPLHIWKFTNNKISTTPTNLAWI